MRGHCADPRDKLCNREIRTNKCLDWQRLHKIELNKHVDDSFPRRTSKEAQNSVKRFGKTMTNSNSRKSPQKDHPKITRLKNVEPSMGKIKNRGKKWMLWSKKNEFWELSRLLNKFRKKNMMENYTWPIFYHKPHFLVILTSTPSTLLCIDIKFRIVKKRRATHTVIFLKYVLFNVHL